MSLGEVCQWSQALCQSVQDLVRILLWQTHAVQVWSGSKRNDSEAELD